MSLFCESPGCCVSSNIEKRADHARNFGVSRSHTSKPHSSPSWFALSASALDKQAVEGRDGFTIMVAPNVLTSVPAVEKAPEAPERHSRHAICWEFVGATSPGA